MMKRVIAYVTVFLVAWLAGCAYFNTFYNAKRYYRRAYAETQKNRTAQLTSAEKQNYEKAVQKASKILEFYPKSKYVDDALLLLGKCFYHQREYLRAERKFEELLTNFPDSEFRAEAGFWLAKTHLAMEAFGRAESGFQRLLEQEMPKQLRGEVLFHLGRLNEERQVFEAAIQAYERVVEEGEGPLRAEAVFAVAANYDSLRQYDRALDAYQRVLAYGPTEELRFEAQFQHGRMEKALGRLDEAIRTFERLLGEEKNKQRAPDLRLEVARCLAQKEDFDGAVIAYQDITQDFKKTRHSAEAYYELGKIHEEVRREYERALEQYTKVRGEFSRSVFIDSARVRGRDIQRLQALIQVIDMATEGAGEDSVVVVSEMEDDVRVQDVAADTAASDSSSLRRLSDLSASTRPDDPRNAGRLGVEEETLLGRERGGDERQTDRGRSEIVPKPEKAENPELKTFRKEELDKNLFLLAELYLFRFSLPDSAVSQYRRIVKAFPESPYAPQALYNLSHVAREVSGDSTAAVDYDRRLVADYPRHPLANTARENLGLRPVMTKEDSVQTIFGEAEAALFEQGDPETALRKYGTILERFPDSEWAPKAALAMGWVYETRLDSLTLAFVAYDSLVSRYPNSPYAEGVKKKVEAVRKQEQARKETEEAEQRVGEETGETTSDDVLLKQPLRREEKTEAMDGLAFPEGGVEAILERIVLPEEVDLSRLAGVVVVRVHVDEEGRVTETQVSRSSGHPGVDRVVEEAIRETAFRPGQEGGMAVDSWVNLSVPIKDGTSEIPALEK